MNIDEVYFQIINKILKEGTLKENRTGVDTISVSGCMLEYDMKNGFPLLTTKKMAWKTIRVELEGFIKGITSKKWYQDRGCHIWDAWCNPSKVPYGHDEETRKRMAAEDDLGPIYGYQWRRFNELYLGREHKLPIREGVDQLAWAIDQLKTNPQNRRIIVSAWNPEQLNQMALVPCHYSFQLLQNNGKLDLLWNQRSVDSFIGLPFNIASYGLLLSLIANECGLEQGKLIGFLADTHIYVNHLDQLKEQEQRKPFGPSKINIANDKSVFDWEWKDARLENYKSHEAIKGKVAI